MSKKEPGYTPKRTDSPDEGNGGSLPEDWDGVEEARFEIPEDSGLTEIARALRNLPDHDPLDYLLSSIMARLKPERRSLASRIREWARRPFSVTLTPLQLIPAACLVLLLLGLTTFSSLRGTAPIPAFPQQMAGVPVMLSLKMPGARTVSVIGSFNEWRPQLCQRISDDSSSLEWTLVLTLPPGRYEYAYIIDDNDVIPDPWNETVQEDGFGNRNSVLYVGNGHDGSI